MMVAQQLDLDMLGPVQEALDKDGAVAKGGAGLGRGALEGVLQGVGITDDAHAAASSAKGGLDDDGEAMFVGEGPDLLVASDGAVGAGYDGDVTLNG